jgi:hypothetical protein
MLVGKVERLEHGKHEDMDWKMLMNKHDVIIENKQVWPRTVVYSGLFRTPY